MSTYARSRDDDGGGGGGSSNPTPMLLMCHCQRQVCQVNFKEGNYTQHGP